MRCSWLAQAQQRMVHFFYGGRQVRALLLHCTPDELTSARCGPSGKIGSERISAVMNAVASDFQTHHMTPSLGGEATTATACLLCTQAGGTTIWEDGFARVVLTGDVDHPGFCRVILNAHETEMTDLSEADVTRFMSLVFAVERSLRGLLAPEKINLASL